jgi:hypothetical protein
MRKASAAIGRQSVAIGEFNMKIDPSLPKPDWLALETAFEHNAPETRSYFDQKTGHVVTVVESRPEDEEKRALILKSPGRFTGLDPASSREQYRWMERFVSSVADDALRERLVLAIDGKGAFRRFKDVLLTYPVERDRWFAYRSTLLHIYINGWLESKELTIGEEPPWGQPSPPVEPDLPLEKATGERPEGPVDLLRAKAFDLLAQLPALELPAAIAFMRYLNDRMPSVADD